jgi:hypothetical protein
MMVLGDWAGQDETVRQMTDQFNDALPPNMLLTTRFQGREGQAWLGLKLETTIYFKIMTQRTVVRKKR